MKKADELKSLVDEYRVPGFRTRAHVTGDAKDPSAFALTLVRRQKKPYAAAAERHIAAFTVDESDACVISIAESGRSTSYLSFAALTASGAA